MSVITQHSSLLLTVDGGFSAWGSFGDCSKSCGNGLATRSRQCNNPSPQHGGADCIGKKEESQSCNIEQCPGNLFIKFVVNNCSFPVSWWH